MARRKKKKKIADDVNRLNITITLACLQSQVHRDLRRSGAQSFTPVVSIDSRNPLKPDYTGSLNPRSHPKDSALRLQ
jgi:hypothetical protein